MLIRFDPFRDLTDQMRGPGTRAVPMEAVRRGDTVLVHFDLPGVDASSIDVTVEKNVLTITAQREPQREEGEEVLIDERPHGAFTRQLFLGDTLDAERIEAEYHDGVLTLAIPVAERAKPRKVQIAAGDGNGARRIQTQQQDGEQHSHEQQQEQVTA
jgi:HSP20 family protein